MTYIVTYNNKAYKVTDNPTFDIEHLVGGSPFADPLITSYHVTMNGKQISPPFNVLDEDETFDDYTDVEYEDARCDMECRAVQWLCDLLERLEQHHPAVIHCVSDGEMFMQPSSLHRR